MRLVELKCRNCGATLNVDPLSTEDITCQFCNTTFRIDDEIKHIKFDDMENNGYEFEKGRIRAQNENRVYQYEMPQQGKTKITIWLILAWIVLFPFMATYFIMKSNRFDKRKKLIIIGAIWVFFISAALITNYQNNKKIKNKIVKCYSEEIYNILDDLLGIKNIKGNFDEVYTCEKLELRDKNYNKISIDYNKETKKLILIIGDEKVYDDIIK